MAGSELCCSKREGVYGGTDRVGDAGSSGEGGPGLNRCKNKQYGEFLYKQSFLIRTEKLDNSEGITAALWEGESLRSCCNIAPPRPLPFPSESF